ncbi:MAG: flavodoxin family protein [Betaproteobacteria bacterium]|nr:flavodoxin family protein [Betaproteobacteria bacterium]
MKILLVHAHPEPQSFCAALKSEALARLPGHGHEVRVSDLYEMNFDPVARDTDFGSRANPDYLVYALEQRHNQKAGTLKADIAAEVDKLLWCDLLLLNFPVFWFSMPAILKGWIDRVFVSGVCYGGLRFYDRGGLAGKKAMTTITIGGQRHMFGPDAVHGELETMLRPLLRGTLYYVGMEVLPPFVAWHVPYVSNEVRAGYLEDYRARLATLDDIEPLAFPSLDDFDEKLHPRRR